MGAFFLISLPIMACGWLSWHLVEKHALAFKTMTHRSPESLAAPVGGNESAATRT
jgi:peptidoglycan/LPS O-acetylase OafA/YrhL